MGSRWVDLAGEHFDHMCFLQGKVSITRPHAQVVKYSKISELFRPRMGMAKPTAAVFNGNGCR